MINVETFDLLTSQTRNKDSYKRQNRIDWCGHQIALALQLVVIYQYESNALFIQWESLPEVFKHQLLVSMTVNSLT